MQRTSHDWGSRRDADRRGGRSAKCAGTSPPAPLVSPAPARSSPRSSAPRGERRRAHHRHRRMPRRTGSRQSSRRTSIMTRRTWPRFNQVLPTLANTWHNSGKRRCKWPPILGSATSGQRFGNFGAASELAGTVGGNFSAGARRATSRQLSATVRLLIPDPTLSPFRPETARLFLTNAQTAASQVANPHCAGRMGALAASKAQNSGARKSKQPPSALVLITSGALWRSCRRAATVRRTPREARRGATATRRWR